MNMPHPEFATWYSTVDLGDSVSRIEARGVATTKLLGRFTYQKALPLVNVMLGDRAGLDGAGAERIRSACREADPTFPVSGNDAEITLLAEIALAIAIDEEGEDALAGKIAEVIYSALANGSREFSSVTSILDRAKDVIERQGRLLRRRPRLPKKPKRYLPPLGFERHFRDLNDLSDLQQATLLMKRIATEVGNGMRSVANSARREREALEQHIKLQDEELDLLWWATNGNSVTAHTLFSEMKVGPRAFVAALEAANRTHVRPGPCSIRGLLEKTGVSKDEKISLADAFGRLDPEVTKALHVGEAELRTPIHMGLKMKRESGDAETWLGHWSSRTGIDSACERPELDIAQLVYQERLVLDAFGEFK
ncbi:MAG: GTPase-associated system all-helical protein GASH [Chloroflexi bacterium]|nr:GTPase-associated system all-helical protein GASH [Chloroflexota bacterium]